jgi:hypothetical protein
MSAPRAWFAGTALALALGTVLPETKLASAEPDQGCLLQRPQSFLKRSSFLKNGQLRGPEHLRALRYRVEKYGHVPGLGLESLNSRPADSFATGARFMGKPLSVHERVVPALRCVEKRIRKRCKKSDSRYVANAVGGFRVGNTYRGGEVSNHLFGIAIDIDPDKNPCCGCVAPWPTHPLCKLVGASIWEKTALTKCWVQAFERYGFYWLGRDVLQDTMHFEFLGDPDRIVPGSNSKALARSDHDRHGRP